MFNQAEFRKYKLITHHDELKVKPLIHSISILTDGLFYVKLRVYQYTKQRKISALMQLYSRKVYNMREWMKSPRVSGEKGFSVHTHTCARAHAGPKAETCRKGININILWA